MKKCLFVINGESFRLGPQVSRTRGIKDSYQRQKLAVSSHIRLFRFIENEFNIKCEVFLNTYHLNNEWDNDLINWYSDYLIRHNFYPTLLENEFSLIHDTINKIKEFNLEEYEFVVFNRTDFYIKKYFLKVFNPHSEKIAYAHIDAYYDYKTINKLPHVCHSITYCPKKYFNLMLENLVWYWHYSAIKLSEHVPKEFITTFIDTVHACCTSLDWNPIYSIVGRDECLEYKFPNDSYDFENGVLLNQDNLSKYKEILYTDTIKDNLQ
jgi:hypothetical protein